MSDPRSDAGPADGIAFVLVHGAFRGGWAWDQLAPLLREAGGTVHAPTLTGCEPASPLAGTRIRLQQWVDDVVSAVDAAAADGRRVVLVTHSQGGLPVRAASAQLRPHVERIVHIDAALPLDGERGVDLNPPEIPPPPPDLDPALWIPATPVGPDQGYDDPALAAFVNERLVPTPLGPSLDPASVTDGPPESLVFCSRTPPTFPSGWSRRRADADGVRYRLLDAAHDAPLLEPAATAAAILAALNDPR